MKEIERKFKVVSVPADMVFFEEKKIIQNYLSIKGDEELRIRCEDGNKNFVMTHKKGTGLTREENEFPICSGMFYDLVEKTEGVSLQKKRKVGNLPSGELVVVDFYGEELGSIITAEVEFESEEKAKSFLVPDWFVEDLTEDKNYKNKNLWKKINNL